MWLIAILTSKLFKIPYSFICSPLAIIDEHKMKRKALIRILIFYLIAISISNIFRFDLLKLREIVENMPVWTKIFYSPMESIGVLIGALISIYLLRKNRKSEFSTFGTSIKWSLIMAIIPIILMTIIGVKDSSNVNAHYYGFISGIGTFIYCFCEEIGWRGYLQDELNKVKEWQRTLIIGFLWYFWHLSFIINQNIIDNLQFLGWMILGSWGIGKVIDSTKSIFAATCFHMIINIMMFNPRVKDGITWDEKLIILGVSVGIWILILRKWEKGQTIANTK